MSNKPHASTSSSLPARPKAQRQLPELMDFPDHILEKIIKNLDAESLFSLLSTHVRLKELFVKMEGIRIESSYINVNVQRVVALNPTRVSVLILSSCHADSIQILSLIEQCPYLTELNTVNSGLSNQHLIDSIASLPELKSLSCTVFWNRPEIFPGNFNNVERVYVECSQDSFLFVVELINRCLKIDRLHVLVLNESFESPLNRDFSVQLDRQRWETLQACTLAFNKISCYRKEIFDSVFANCPRDRGIRFENFDKGQDVYVYRNGSFNSRDPTLQVPSDEALVLIEANRLHDSRRVERAGPYRRPRDLRITRVETPRSIVWSPASTPALSTIVALNLSGCPGRIPAETWRMLVCSLTAIESLTVPLCFLWTSSGGQRASPGGSKQTWQSNHILLQSLEKLGLKKLCLMPMCSIDFSFHTPHLPRFERFRSLEELLLVDPPMRKDFFSRVTHPNLKALRIRDMRRELGLRILESSDFSSACKRLQFLKLDSPTLPLNSPLLWKALSRTKLKQLCLSSEISCSISIDMMRILFPKLSETLEVIHVHAPNLENGESFRSFVESEIAKINESRSHPLRFLILVHRTARQFGHYIFIPNFPGRGLCCIDFNPVFRPEAWKMG